MELRKANLNDFDDIRNLTYKTITEVYPNYYIKEGINGFLFYHSNENIREDLENGNSYVALLDDQIVGTATVHKNEVLRFFIEPNFQRKGIGAKFLRFLENEISKEFDTVTLAASIPGSMFYDKLGYKTVSHDKVDLENNKELIYEIMEKKLR